MAKPTKKSARFEPPARICSRRASGDEFAARTALIDRIADLPGIETIDRNIEEEEEKMRPYNGYYEDYDDSDEFVYDKSEAFQRLLDEGRREQRHRNRHRGFDKVRRHRQSWDWDDDDDDWESYLDDSSGDLYEELNGRFY